MRTQRRLSASQRREKQQGRIGLALIVSSVLAASTMLYGAHKVDEARGISVDQSLASVGL